MESSSHKKDNDHQDLNHKEVVLILTFLALLFLGLYQWIKWDEQKTAAFEATVPALIEKKFPSLSYIEPRGGEVVKWEGKNLTLVWIQPLHYQYQDAAWRVWGQTKNKDFFLMYYRYNAKHDVYVSTPPEKTSKQALLSELIAEKETGLIERLGFNVKEM